NRVGFHSVVGDEPLGVMGLERLRESGVDVAAVRKLAGKKTGLTVVLPQPDRRFILTYLGVMSEMRFEDLDFQRIGGAPHLHLSSYFLQKALRPRVPELFRFAKEQRMTTSLDTNDDPEDRWERDVLDVLQWVDVLLPNEREACRLAGVENAERALEFLAAK